MMFMALFLLLLLFFVYLQKNMLHLLYGFIKSIKCSSFVIDPFLKDSAFTAVKSDTICH